MLLFASIVLAEHSNNSDVYRSPGTLVVPLFIVFPLRLGHNAALKNLSKHPQPKMDQEPLNFVSTPFLPFHSPSEAKSTDFCETESYQYIILLELTPMGLC